MRILLYSVVTRGLNQGHDHFIRAESRPLHTPWTTAVPPNRVSGISDSIYDRTRIKDFALTGNSIRSSADVQTICAITNKFHSLLFNKLPQK